MECKGMAVTDSIFIVNVYRNAVDKDSFWTHEQRIKADIGEKTQHYNISTALSTWQKALKLFILQEPGIQLLAWPTPLS